MKQWKKPVIISLCENDITSAIRAAAWSEMCFSGLYR